MRTCVWERHPILAELRSNIRKRSELLREGEKFLVAQRLDHHLARRDRRKAELLVKLQRRG